MHIKFLFTGVVMASLLASCSKSSETLTLGDIRSYNLQQPGKYIIYQLDSLVFINFGKKDTTISYQIKDSVAAQITDNLGRTAFRIMRFIRKTAANAWTPTNTFMTVPTDNTIEFVENNLRFIKLKQPLRDGFSWKGNAYIDTRSSGSPYAFLDDWDYFYQNMNAKITLGSLTVDSTITVNQADTTYGNRNDIDTYSERNYGLEHYAKGIGLVYRKLEYWEYQPPPPPPPGVPLDPARRGTRTGYGITLTMLSHN
jgi:hypothetical protein